MIQILDELEESHFVQMYELEKEFYSEAYITPYQEAYEWYRHYPNTTFAAAEEGRVVGFINLFPVKSAVFDNLKSGRFNDKDLTVDDIEELDAEVLHMFLSCLVVGRHKRKQGVTDLLLRTAVDYYRPYARRCGFILADAVTLAGNRFSQRYGFQPLQASDHDTQLYIQTYKSFQEKIERGAMHMKVFPIKAFSDNYIWVLEEGEDVVIVDPGEASGVLSYLAEKQPNVKAILLTHKHDDHVGGVEEILAQYPDTPVYGPQETEKLATKVVQEGDSFELLGRTFQVFLTAGHTEEHISYLTGDSLFCGDALFSGGCGRVFTKDYQAQYDALQKFQRLDDAVKVYAAHEYTQTNLRFAQTVEPDNEAVAKALKEADDLRTQDQPTLPSTIGKEKAVNLFLQAESLADFISLRNARDQF